MPCKTYAELCEQVRTQTAEYTPLNYTIDVKDAIFRVREDCFFNGPDDLEGSIQRTAENLADAYSEQIFDEVSQLLVKALAEQLFS